MSGFKQLEDVVQDDRFVELDLLLRRGHHLGREAHDLYTFVLDALEPLEVLPPAVGLTVSPVLFGHFRGSRDPVISL